MRYRVDQLAARAGTSVDTVRFYQTKGLLAPPDRDGRVAWYSDDHLDRLRRIRDLKNKGFTLTTIKRILDGSGDAADRALAEAVTGALPGEAGEAEEFLTVDELARRTGVSPALLEAVQRDGLLVARIQDGETVYTPDDVAAVAAGVALLEAGLPLSELLALAREHHTAMRAVARRAVDLFVEFVRDGIRASSPDEGEAAERLVTAFHQMFGATSALVAHHFRRVLLAEALARMEEEGLESEIAAVRAEATKRLGSGWPT